MQLTRTVTDIIVTVTAVITDTITSRLAQKRRRGVGIDVSERIFPLELWRWFSLEKDVRCHMGLAQPAELTHVVNFHTALGVDIAVLCGF